MISVDCYQAALPLSWRSSKVVERIFRTLLRGGGRRSDSQAATSCFPGLSVSVLGERTAPRRMRTIEEKRRIVEETLKRGASVAVVAGHEVNANLVFGWRRLYQKGLLEPQRIDDRRSASASCVFRA